MFTLALALYVDHSRSMPDLAVWHREVPAPDFDVDSGIDSWEGLMAQEAALFEALDREVERMNLQGLAADLERYAPGSDANPAHFDPNWNRSYVLTPDGPPKGGALLLHGLSDSPYSLRAVAEVYAAHDWVVIGLRLPGHGAVPAGIAHATWQDWRAATRLAAQELDRLTPEGRPFVIGGYSTGAPLAVDRALDVIESGEGRMPTELVLLSPAIGVTPLAALARVQRWVSYLPGLEKLGWTSIAPEYDPYKFNSFPVFAGEQVYGLTLEVGRRLLRLQGDDRLQSFPPVLAFQSVVDSTILASAVLDRLLAPLDENGSEIVLFDVNERAKAAGLIVMRHDLRRRVVAGEETEPYAVTLVTNEDESTFDVVARTRAANDTTWSEEPLDLAWPLGVYSLSHVALPFPEDDPIYGADPQGRLALGVLELRGERGVFGLSMDQMMRLRYNPFFAYVAKRITRHIERDAAAADGAQPTSGSNPG